MISIYPHDIVYAVRIYFNCGLLYLPVVSSLFLIHIYTQIFRLEESQSITVN